jgi:hypothetical protein
MAKWKWTPKRRAAFKRMISKNPGRKRRRGRARRRNPGCAVPGTATNPRRRRRRNAGAAKARRRITTSRQVTTINPRRRRHSATAGLGRILALLPIGGGRHMAKRRKSRGRRRRRNPGALMVNPRRRRRRRARRSNPRRRHHRRRRNPGIGAYAKQGIRDIAIAAIPATLGGILIGFVDAKLLGPMGTIGRNIGKLLVTAGAAALLRKKLGPVGTGVMTGAILGTIGHEFGVRIGGGMVTMTKREGVRELVEMAATDAETQAELGALVEGEGGDSIDGEFKSAAADYEEALAGGIPPEYAALAAADDADFADEMEGDDD